MWAKLTGKLRDANIAHADLQHGNVLLVPGNTPSKLGLKLIDYDGMWVPPLADNHSGEVGHPNFQHPLRLKDRLFNADVDRFPHLVIACALRATLVGGKSLWQKFDNGDNLLFREQDLRDPAKSQVFKSLWNLNDGVVRALVGHISMSSQRPLRKTPWLDDLLLEENGPKLIGDEEKQVVSLLGVAASAPKTDRRSTAPAVLNDYSEFDVVDDDEEEGDKPLAVRDDESDEDRERRARRVSRKKKKRKKAQQSKLPILLGGGALALVLAVVAVLTLSKKDRSATQLAQKAQGESDAKSSSVAKTAPVEPKTARPSNEPTVDRPRIELPPDKEPEPVVKAPELIKAIATVELRPAAAGICFSMDGKYIGIVEEGGKNVAIVDGQTGAMLNRFAVPRWVHRRPLAFVGDDRICLETEDPVQLWDWRTGRMIHEESNIKHLGGNFVTHIRSSPDGQKVLVGMENPVLVWNLANLRAPKKFRCFGETRAVIGDVFPNCDRVAYMVDKPQLHLAVWDLVRNRESPIVFQEVAPPEDRQHTEMHLNIRVSPNGHWIVRVTNPKGGKTRVDAWDTATGKLRFTVANLDRIFVRPVFDGSGDFCILYPERRRVIVDLPQGKIFSDLPMDALTEDAHLAPGANLLAEVYSGGSILKINRLTLGEGGVVAKAPDPENANSPKNDDMAASDDRKAIAWVLSFNTDLWVRTGGQKVNLRPGTKVPSQPCELLNGNLGGKNIDDMQLAILKDCKSLESIFLQNNPITDAGLVHLKNCKSLKELSLFETKVTDKGMVNFKDFVNLRMLQLNETLVTDAGMANFSGCSELEWLNLHGTRVGDAGLAHFTGCQRLRHLGLANTRITDAGLLQFKDCTSLKEIEVNGTKVTAAALNTMKKALPNCRLVGPDGKEVK